MDNRPIGMFDSGIGGLTVLRELRKRLPNEEIIYLGDTKRFPYGSKTKENIIQISRECIKFLISKNVKLVIIACGTATSQSLDVLQEEFNIPIIGIIEPTVSFLAERIKNESANIGVIATAGTIRSNVWEEQLKSKMPNINVINEKTPLLATMAEEGWINNKVAEYTIKEYMRNLKNIDKLILGCTHYPLFEPLIKKELSENAEIINTGTVVSQYLENFIRKNNIENNKTEKNVQILFTDLAENSTDKVKNILDDMKNIKIDKAEI
jgi:glutamate racemase